MRSGVDIQEHGFQWIKVDKAHLPAAQIWQCSKADHQMYMWADWLQHGQGHQREKARPTNCLARTQEQ